MAKFKFSVTNGHYLKGSTVELRQVTAKAFEKLGWGTIVTDNEPKQKTSKTNSKKK